MNSEKIEKITISMPRDLVLVAALLAGLFTSVVANAVNPPHGYERLALHSPSTIRTTVFNKVSPGLVFDYFANALSFGPDVDEIHVKDLRLIDIEINISDGALHNIQVSGIGIENDGYYKQDTWLAMGLTESDLIEWPLKGDFIPLDIERYTQGGGKHLFAVIWQRNHHEVDWEVRLEEGPDAILRKIDEGYRVVDFDQFHAHLPNLSASGQYFDAILVENSGNNYMNATWKKITANPLETLVTFFNEPLNKPEVYYEQLIPDFIQVPSWRNNIYKNFFLLEDEKLVDVEFVEFPTPWKNPNYPDAFQDFIFPDTWAVVISHPTPPCNSKIMEGILNWGEGLSAFHAESDVGKVIDLEGTEPLQNKPSNNASLYGHNSSFYGPPGFGQGPIHIHACN